MECKKQLQEIANKIKAGATVEEASTNLLKKYPNYFSVEYEEGNWKIYKLNK